MILFLCDIFIYAKVTSKENRKVRTQQKITIKFEANV